MQIIQRGGLKVSRVSSFEVKVAKESSKKLGLVLRYNGRFVIARTFDELLRRQKVGRYPLRPISQAEACPMPSAALGFFVPPSLGHLEIRHPSLLY